MKHKPKQRAAYFTDEDWLIITSAAKLKGYPTAAAYMRAVLVEKAKRDIKNK